MKTKIDISKKVRVTDAALADRRDAAHYAGQEGAVKNITGGIPEHAMVFWPGLSCSSLWEVKQLENVQGKVTVDDLLPDGDGNPPDIKVGDIVRFDTHSNIGIRWDVVRKVFWQITGMADCGYEQGWAVVLTKHSWTWVKDILPDVDALSPT